MSEISKSVSFGGAALLMGALAFFTAPAAPTPDAFLDRGEAFFPEFENPNDARTLEVIEFNEETAEASPFKVSFIGGKWTIPSHHDYPADGEDQLAQTAAGVIGIKKDDFRTNNVSDHEACGVLDPLDEGDASLKGRGRRVTIRGESEQILADLIIGNEVEGRDGFRFVRLPSQKRVYVSKMDLDISSDFADWINKDVLDVDRYSVEQIVVKDYSIDERTFSVDQRDVVTVVKKDGVWVMDKMPGGREVDNMKMDGILRELDTLSIVGVRPKPAGLSRSLSKVEGGGLSITQDDMFSLQGKGFYFSRDGALLSNEGEIQARSTDGITYTLRFGEIVYGMGEAISAGAASNNDSGSGPGENRYLFVTTTFDPSVLPEPSSPKDLAFKDKAEEEWTDEDKVNKELDDKHQEWQQKMREGQERTDELNGRFADWYYVIPASAFDTLHVKREDFLKVEDA
jgi:hypothetical protein